MKFGKKIFLLAIIAVMSVKAMAQGTLPTDPDNSVPLDGGLTIAIVAGISYGVKRSMKKKAVTAEVTETTEK